MKIVIVGLGRIGKGLALELSRQAHDVTVVDLDPLKFKQIEKEFRGRFIQGSGYDRKVIEEIGLIDSDVVICLTDSDEVNSLVGRIAKNYYHVPKVIARLYDPRKESLYKRLSLEILSPTSWAIDTALDMIGK